ncbi:MAG: type VII secretion integral membrane protein EccD [Micromonosporaceae bacterium]|nr:type VII secretion integral membrane protein EccD [Micromonosporaceae bacterium]
MTGSTPGLTRLVVFAPKRRLELAFPNQLPVAYLLPDVLRHAGEELADRGLTHGGWVLRRSDGSRLDAGSSFAAQQVRDGEVLHLVPRQVQWPETSYDDIVDAIAASARRRGARWSGAATRIAGLGLAGTALLVGLVTALSAGPPWTVTAVLLLLVAGGLLLAGVLLARALGDATAGAVVAAAALPYGFAGGLVLLADESLSRIGAPHLLTGSAVLITAGIAGYLGTGEYGRLFMAGVTAAGWGLVGAVVALLFAGAGAAGAAAVVVGGVLLVSPLVPAVAIRVGRIPLPDLPHNVDDLVDDRPPPDRRSVEQATARTDEVLTGGLLGMALAGVAALAMLVVTGDAAALVLAAAVSAAFLLRARFHVAVRHRVPLLALGAAGLGLVGVALGLAGGADRVVVMLPAVAGAALLALAAGMTYRHRPPSPRLGRFADIGDVLLTLAVVPLVAEVVGLYAYVRGLAG